MALAIVLPLLLVAAGLVVTVVVWRRERATGERPMWLHAAGLVGTIAGAVALGLGLRHGIR